MAVFVLDSAGQSARLTQSRKPFHVTEYVPANFKMFDGPGRRLVGSRRSDSSCPMERIVGPRLVRQINWKF